MAIPNRYYTYTTKPHDTLPKISHVFRIPISSLLKLNPLIVADYSMFQPGFIMKLPYPEQVDMDMALEMHNEAREQAAERHFVKIRMEQRYENREDEDENRAEKEESEEEREEEDYMLPLELDDDLSAQAKAWAEELARRNLNEGQDENEMKDPACRALGQVENVKVYSKDEVAPISRATEEQFLHGETLRDCDCCWEKGGARHYQRLMRPEIRKVGMATTRNEKNTYVVVRYSPVLLSKEERDDDQHRKVKWLWSERDRRGTKYEGLTWEDEERVEDLGYTYYESASAEDDEVDLYDDDRGYEAEVSGRGSESEYSSEEDSANKRDAADGKEHPVEGNHAALSEEVADGVAIATEKDVGKGDGNADKDRDEQGKDSDQGNGSGGGILRSKFPPRTSSLRAKEDLLKFNF